MKIKRIVLRRKPDGQSRSSSFCDDALSKGSVDQPPGLCSY